MKAVYDVTIGYAKDNVFLCAPSLWETLSVPRIDQHWQFHVHVDRHPLESLPGSDDELASWLEQRWIEKGERLEELRERITKDC